MKTINVLVVDDEEMVRSLIYRALAKSGHNVCAVSDAIEGKRLVRSARWDVVITDIFMPRKDGIEFIEELSREFPGIRIIAISGELPALKWVETADIVTLQKPFDVAELVSMVERAVL